MGWSIFVIENTAQVPLDKRAAVAKAIIENSDVHYGEDPDDVNEAIRTVFWGTGPGDTHIQFDSDHMEHMDYVTENDAICEAMAAAGVEGRICFGSLEGDNKGSFWGVEFKEGTYSYLTGEDVRAAL